MKVMGREDREEKLPKWAQEKLDFLRMRLMESHDALAIERGEGTTKDEPHVLVGDKLYPLHTRVEFKLGPKLGEAIGVNVIRHSKQGRTMLVVRGNDQIAVWPSASNTVEVSLDRNY